jgi:predicted phosphate transport protein (TIGR00153 family)
MFKRFLPREDDFYGQFEQIAGFVIRGAEVLKNLLDDYTNVGLKLQELESFEHACDQVTHSTIQRLNESFLTPFDREDIHTLTLRLDDVLDMIEAAAQRMQTCRIAKPTEDARKLGYLILQQAELLLRALNALRDIRNYNNILDHCVEIHRLENQADLIMKGAVGRLFDEEKDPIELIKMKEVYENLEVVTDRCETVANLIQGIAVKMS